jgi:hypothetical protein
MRLSISDDVAGLPFPPPITTAHKTQSKTAVFTQKPEKPPIFTPHQENSTLLGRLEMLECTRVARILGLVSIFEKKFSSSLVRFSRSSTSSSEEKHIFIFQLVCVLLANRL